MRAIFGAASRGWRPDAIALALLGILSIGAIAPLAVPWLPLTHDWGFHWARTAGLIAAWADGDWYPRWLPDAALGLGQPILNFYSPLAYLPAGLGATLTGSLPIGLNLTMAVALLASAVAFYAFARRVTGDRWAAVAGAAVYLYAPYHLIDAYRRGALPETLALAWLPIVLLGCFFCARAAGRAGPATLAAGLAGVVLTHNLTAALFLPVAIAYAALLVAGGQGRRTAAVRRLLMGAAIGAGLSAPFWLPALAEAPVVRIDTFTPTGFRPRDTLIPWADLIGWRGWAFDYADDRLALRIGLVQAAIIAASLATWVCRGRPGGRIAWFPAGLTAACLIGLTDLARPFWEATSALDYLQFSWRLLGPAALGTAWLVARAIAGAGRWKYAAGAAIAGAIAVSSLAGLKVDYLALDPGPPSRLDLYRRDAGGVAEGKLPDGEFAPRWRAAIDPTRAALDTTPGPEVVRLLSQHGTRWLLAVEAGNPSRLEIPQAYFPGWRATVDGRSAEVAPSPDGGLVAVSLPAGARQVDVSFGETPPRLIGWGLWFATLAAAILIAVGRPSTFVAIRRPALVGAAAILSVGSGLALAGRAQAIPSKSTAINEAVSPDRFLLGLDGLSRTEGGLFVTLVWAPAGADAPADAIRLRLWDPSGRAVVEAEPGPIARVPAAPGRIGRESYLLPLPSDVAPGSYTLEIGAAGAEGGVAVPVEVASPPAGPRLPDLRPVSIAFGPEIGLEAAGWGVPRLGRLGRTERIDQPAAWESVDPGSPLLVELRWRAMGRPRENYHVFVHVIGPDGAAVAQTDNQPGSRLAPTSAWQPGDRIADRHRLRVPPGLPPGLYDLRVGLYRLGSLERLPAGAGGETSISIGRVKVGPPPAGGPLGQRQAAVFGDVLRLDAIELPDRRPDRLLVTSDWSAERPVPDDYTLFAHVIDGAGRLVAQSDGPPNVAGTAYPTTYWAPGERVRHTAEVILPPDLPAGAYRVLIGAYRTVDVRRLTLPDGRDAVEAGILDLPVGSR